MNNNKWTIHTSETFKCGESTVTKTHLIAIPPTSGDRVDVLTTQGHYYYDVNPKKLKLLEYPDRTNDTVEIYVVIKNGEPEVTHKFK